MTSNLGAHYIQEQMERLDEANKEATMILVKEQIMELLKKSLRPEFLNRVDEVVVFSPLTKSDMKGIVGMQIGLLQEKLKNMGIRIHFDNLVADYLSDLGYDPQFGARPVKRILQKDIINDLSKKILSGEINKETEINATIRNGVVAFENKE